MRERRLVCSSVRRSSGIAAWAALICAAVAGAHLRGSAPRESSPHALSDVHREMLERLDSGEAEAAPNTAVCFAPGTSDEVIAAFAAAIARLDPDRFQQTGRWSGGVAMGSSGGENQPITLTYSFAPDGTLIPSGVGEPSAGSNLSSWLTGMYGSAQAWQALFHQAFERWEAFSGVHFVHESNDDGAAFFGNQGQLGVRGDIRIGAKAIDGSPVGGSTLAYAQFPNTGEIVFDSSDTYFAVTSNNSRRLRNVASHELGHAIGMLHVCPVIADKLMEPIASTAYDGPRHDDVRSAQDFYGDLFEPNEAAIAATNLGVVTSGSTLQPGVIANPAIASTSGLSLNEKEISPFTNDEDWYRFSSGGKVNLTITVSPVGLTYQDNPQACPASPQECCSGNTTDSLRVADLSVQLLDSSGSFLLANGAAHGLGESEQLFWSTSVSESFNLRVFTTTNSFLEPQMYSLTIAAAPPPEPGAFTLVSPANGGTDIETGPVLDWSDSTGAATYLVEVDTDVALGSPDISQVVMAPTSMLDLPNGALPYDTQHFWRVTATNAFGSTVSTPSVSGFRTTAVIPCPCTGDIDGDCDTDVFDFAILASNFAQSVPIGTNGDLNDDGFVNITDFGLLAGNFSCMP